MIEAKLRDLEGKFSDALMDLERNLSFLENTRRDLEFAKERYESSHDNYLELEANLKEIIEGIEGVKSEYVERFEAELVNLENIKETVLASHRLAIENMQKSSPVWMKLLRKTYLTSGKRSLYWILNLI